MSKVSTRPRSRGEREGRINNRSSNKNMHTGMSSLSDADAQAHANTNAHGRDYKTLDEYEDQQRRKGSPMNHMYGNNINGNNNGNNNNNNAQSRNKMMMGLPASPMRSSTSSKRASSSKVLKPIAPPKSSSLPRRRSPQREKERQQGSSRIRNMNTHSSHDNGNGDHGNSNHGNHGNSRQAKERHPSKTPASNVQQFFRKSAIQDVIKTFQCNDKSTKEDSSTVQKRSHKYNARAHRIQQEQQQYQQQHQQQQQQQQQQQHHQFNPMNNSLLEKETQAAFHPFESDSVHDSSSKTNALSPLKELFANPMGACKAQFMNNTNSNANTNANANANDNVTTRNITSRVNCLGGKHSRKNDHDYDGGGDDAFLKFKDTWCDEDLSDVFRPKSPSGITMEEEYANNANSHANANIHAQFTRHGTEFERPKVERGLSPSQRIQEEDDGAGADEERQEEERYKRAAMDSVKKLIQFPDGMGNSYGNRKSSSTNGVLHPSPRDVGSSRKSPRRDRHGRSRSRSRSRSGSRSKHHSNRDGVRTVKDILQNRSRGGQGVTSTKSNSNLLDESVSVSVSGEESPMAETVTNTKTHIIKGRTPGTEHTARMTPSPISPCTDRANNNNTLKNSSETLNSLRGVKLTLFQTDNGEKIEDGEVAIAAKATALEAENEALRKQLARHKANIIDHEKSDNLESLKGRAGGSDAGSILSNGCDSVVSRSELLCMKAELVKLKAKLSEKDAEIDDVRKENEKHDSSQKQRIQQMTKNLKNYKSKAEYDALESKVQTLQKGLAVYKEQLLESDEYVSELEKTIDDQLRIWQEEEDTFRAEVTGLREKSVKSAAYESQYVIAQKEVNELKQDLFNANHDVKEIRAMNQKLEENKRTCVEVERAARESTERYEERIRVFQEEKDSLKIEVEKLKEDANDLKERSISIDVENGMEIKKLREQLGHAAFRVQVMRNESPKRKRHGDSNDTSEQSTIARLMKQLKAADTKAETAQEAKRQAEESLISIKSIEIEAESDGKNPSNDIVEALTKKLYDARSRSRRIAVKSEEELSKLRDSESDMRNLAYMHEKQASDLQQRLKKVQHTYSEEAGTRKRIESALRNELSLLRQEKTITASSSLLPKSMKTHSNRIETELEKLVLVTSTLQKSMNLIAKAKKKIAKEMLQKMIKDIDELRSIVSKVEVAAEEDKLQIENAFNVYESAVQSYETQLDGLQNKMKVVKNELSEHLSTRIENTKKTKQVEMDLQAKIRSLTLRLSTLQREYEECKQHVESQDDGSPNSIASSDVLGIINLAPSDEITAVEDFRQPHQTKVNDMPPMRSESKSSIPRPVKKKLSMKLQYGITNSEVEVNLRDGDETRGASMISTRNDLFTSYRSLERSAIEAVAEDSNAKKEEVPQNKMGNIVDTSTGSITSSIRDEKSCNDTSWSSQGSLSGLDASADSHTSQHEPLSNHESVETIEGEYESDEGRMHRDSLKDANHSDTSQANKNNDTSYSSLLETEGLSKILTRSDSDIGIMQTGGEGTNTSRISQAGSCMESIGGDSMIIQHRGEESTSGSIFNTSLACVDLSGVMHARGEDSLEDSVIYNKDVHVESKFDLTTQGHTCDFDYDDTTQRSV